jgi:hypothetical protein
MAQVSTGMGLAILGGCILGAAALTSHKFGGEAFAQGTGTERRIVSAGVNSVGGTHYSGSQVWSAHYAYRIWSDNTIDLRCLGYTGNTGNTSFLEIASQGNFTGWTTVDNGTSAYLRADVDESRSVDSGDISAVLLDFGSTTDNPPPPIDCFINSPR